MSYLFGMTLPMPILTRAILGARPAGGLQPSNSVPYRIVRIKDF